MTTISKNVYVYWNRACYTEGIDNSDSFLLLGLSIIGIQFVCMSLNNIKRQYDV